MKIAQFGSGIARFIKLEPVRTAMIIRIFFYLVTAVIYGTVVDPQFLLESVVTAVLGSAADALKSNDTRNRVVPAVVQDEASKLSAAGEVGAFAVKLISSLNFVSGGTIAKALEVVMPYLSGIAGFALTPELQREVTAELHSRLRGAGMLRTVELGGKK